MMQSRHSINVGGVERRKRESSKQGPNPKWVRGITCQNYRNKSIVSIKYLFISEWRLVSKETRSWEKPFRRKHILIYFKKPINKIFIERKNSLNYMKKNNAECQKWRDKVSGEGIRRESLQQTQREGTAGTELGRNRKQEGRTGDAHWAGLHSFLAKQHSSPHSVTQKDS